MLSRYVTIVLHSSTNFYVKEKIKGGKMEASIPEPIHLVEWFLQKEKMSHKKIQKLCFYAQAFSLVINNEDIVPGIEFEAWVHGPVNHQIYQICKKFGWRDICITPNLINESRNEIYSVFSPKQLELLEQVWSAFGRFSADQLETMTHNEDPWLLARGDATPFEASSAKLNNEIIKKYYSKYYVEQ